MMNDEHYMKIALAEAQKAFNKEEVPIGAVIVMQDKIIAKGYNQVELMNDSTAHAEIIALTLPIIILAANIFLKRPYTLRLNHV